jgi:hypothetical protein
MTPRRLSRQIRDRAVACADLSLQVRELAAWVRPGSELARVALDLSSASEALSSCSIAVLLGRTEILPELAEARHQPPRPLLDAIEARQLHDIADQIAPAVAARGDTDPAWADQPVPTVAPEHPAAAPARAAARRRKAGATRGGGA